MRQWRLIDSGEGDAFFNMAIDEAIALTVMNGANPPTLRFYGWRIPSVSLGYFQRIDDIDLAYCIECNVPVVRRPTGGRAILHGDELTYSFSAQNSDEFSRGLRETYNLIGNAFFSAFQMVGLDVEMMAKRQKGSMLTRSPLCFNSTSLGEISLKGIKLLGSAQRRWREGFLQQGSIPYSIDEGMMHAVFKVSPQNLINLKGLNSFINLNKEALKSAITEAFEKTFNVRLLLSHPSRKETLLAERLLEEKYLRPEWNLSRGHQDETFLMLNDSK
jgi:lipoate-protein ligase A